MADSRAELAARFGDRLKQDEPLAKHVNFRIGGPADAYLEAKTADEAVEAIRIARTNRMPWVVIGGGSNVLVSDAGFRGLVIQTVFRGWRQEGNRVTADAGVLSVFLARATVDAGLTGFEWAIGLPGTVGGAVRGNAGCFGGEMKDSVETVRIYDPGADAERLMTWAECKFGYRDSIIKHMQPAPVVLDVTLALAPGDKKAGKARLDEIIRARKEKQPQGASSAGCMFKNVALNGKEDLWKLRQETDIPSEFMEAKSIPAGWLIDQADLKGTKVGDAEVSDKHGNFCLNRGSATADQVVQLTALIKSNIRNRFGVQLEEEVQLIGF